MTVSKDPMFPVLDFLTDFPPVPNLLPTTTTLIPSPADPLVSLPADASVQPLFIPLRQSQRQKIPSKWFTDYVVNNCAYPMSHYLCYDSLSPAYAENAFGILLNQQKYSIELIADSRQGGAKPASTPLDFNQKHTSYEFDVSTGCTTDDKMLEDPGGYQRLVGRLLYLTMTRPDISFVVQALSQFMHKPKESHMHAAIRVIRYIKNAPGLSLHMSSTTSSHLFAYCDSDWATCPKIRKSVTGYMVGFGTSLISWKLKKQETISRSSVEAEFRSMASTVAELSWLT
uniref:Reverse transcriptase Ty1/copia-type domain-containing protein n=1 Tax=Solanum lycopersicum TaxID=4081 RepID=A0A3Q7IJ85_SOLLC